MRIVSWNINGLRSSLRKGFAESMQKLDADIICLQEIKSEQTQLRQPVLHGYKEYWNSSTAKKGYSGTMILSRTDLHCSNGINAPEFDNEGRAITAEVDDFYLVTVYTPNSQAGLKRLPYRLAWEEALRQYLLELETRKPVILCGDLNVAHHEIDLAHPARNRGKSCFSEPEREQLEKLFAIGYMDAFRLFESGGEHYTFWRFNKGTREKNLGWRIDYFCVAEMLDDRIHNCYHRPDIMGSDHCPVVLELL
jgi:exodeoxyribonuclease-3